jgi:hypothetical protein
MINSVKHLTDINGSKIMTNEDRPMCVDKQGNDSVDWDASDVMREEFPICVDHEKDMISFKMLTKPASEGGNLQLCQLTDLVSMAYEMLQYFNQKFPCVHNDKTLVNLQQALHHQEERTIDREERGVEGKDKL